ncbi:MAG: bifunctional folylpolyglutamate synthase/dihydrofolate synthase, partial [Sphingomicrobium sp.]
LKEVIDADHGIESSFFEVTTAAAFLAFARTPADACILEVGLGGRLDATNVITQPVSCGIAQLAIDHQDFLGRRLIDIAGEKAGIAKRGAPLVTQRYPAAIAARIGEIANDKCAQWLPRGRVWTMRVVDRRLRYRDAKGALDLPALGLDGRHQAGNAGLAAAMLRHQEVVTFPDESIVRGLASATWAGRLHQLRDGPLTARLPGRRVWVDGAHNGNAAKALARAMADRAPIDAIFALSTNRRVADVLGPVAPLIRKAQTVPLYGHAHLDPREIAMIAQGRVGPRHCYPAFTLDEAIERLANDPHAAADILIFGSLYLAGEALAANGETPD